MEKEKKGKKKKPLTANDVLKYEIAAELGLTDKVESTGWKSLTARESGRIGGIMARKKRDYKRQGIEWDTMRVEEIRIEDNI